MTILEIFLIINSMLSLITVFKEERDVPSTWAWLIVLILLPGFGWILYLFIGKKISNQNIFDLKKQERLGLKYSMNEQKQLLHDRKIASHLSDDYEKELINLFLNTEDALYTEQNMIEIIVDGHEKFNKLIQDIQQATSYIHLQYYIIQNDVLGKTILKELTKKAKEGLEVLVLYDALGSRTINPFFFRKLTKFGGVAVPFFGSKIPFVNLRMNYRNHRKIVVIDGKIGYVGGFNIGDEYLGNGKMGNWRDTHFRIQGEAVHSLQTKFFVDWNAVVTPDLERGYSELYFPKVFVKSNRIIPLQIVASGPESEKDQIKLGFLKMISLAKESIYIQTPYFIPDESVMDALKIAIQSGIAVHIMIPNQPDHIFVYRATEYYARLFAQLGAHIYIYNHGFLHAKTLVVDSRIASVGTANFDIRSFKLNFEVSAFVYDKSIAQKLENYFKADMQKSLLGTTTYFKEQSILKKIKQQFSRLLSPIL